jgi:pyruvate kinase
MDKRTNIVCTLGPASESEEMLTNMVNAGMNVARLNFSHGTHENHAMLIERVRSIAKKTGKAICILQDIQGPKIRVGKLPEEGVELKEGEVVVFDTSLDEYDGSSIPLDYKTLHEHLKAGERVLLNDGKSECLIESVEGTKIITKVTVPGNITSHKGMNVPDSTLEMRVLTEKDKGDIKFGVSQNVDMIALSFVMRPDDITDVKALIVEYEKELGITPEQPIRIVAKIERREAVDRINEILEVTDALMVARGDLGIEIPAAEVPVTQKMIINAALDHAKPVIVATQMLDSMYKNPRPTRAEVSDVANAVIDHADAVMLSNETSTGDYPLEAVQTMAEIITETEKSTYDDMPLREHTGEKQAVDDVISKASRILGENTGAAYIVVASLSGGTARLVSRHRPQVAIAVATPHERVRNQLALSWGVHPFILPSFSTIDELVDGTTKYLKNNNMIESGNTIIVVAGEPVGYSGHVNVLEVHEVV